MRATSKAGQISAFALDDGHGSFRRTGAIQGGAAIVQHRRSAAAGGQAAPAVSCDAKKQTACMGKQ